MRNDKQTLWLACALGVLPVIWLGLLLAPLLHAGLPGILAGLSDAMAHPFAIRLWKDSARAVLLALVLRFGSRLLNLP